MTVIADCVLIGSSGPAGQGWQRNTARKSQIRQSIYRGYSAAELAALLHESSLVERLSLPSLPRSSSLHSEGIGVRPITRGWRPRPSSRPRVHTATGLGIRGQTARRSAARLITSAVLSQVSFSLALSHSPSLSLLGSCQDQRASCERYSQSPEFGVDGEVGLHKTIDPQLQMEAAGISGSPV
jgi:hypothetical protein